MGEPAYEKPAYEGTIEKLVPGGDGLTRLNGKIVFIPFVIPGERILFEILIPGKTIFGEA